MSKLRELNKFLSHEVALIEEAENYIKNNVVKTELSSIRKAISYSDSLRAQIDNRLRMGNNELLNVWCKDILDIEYKRCAFTGNVYPVQILEVVPEGYILIEYLLRRDRNCQYEYNEVGAVVQVDRLYGDRDILNYSTDPLEYLSFKCLPNERLSYNKNEDEGFDEMYNGCDPIFLGVELEVERRSDAPRNIERMTIGDLGKEYAILKSDGSVPNGYEIVTAPCTLGYHLTRWEKFFNNSAKYLSSYVSGNCGMHVHISRKAFTPLHLGKMIAFYNNHENRSFITHIAGRSSSYAKFTEDKAFHIKSKIVSQIEAVKKLIAKEETEKTGKLNLEQAKNEVMILKSKLNTTGSSDCTSLIHNLTSGGERYSAVNLTKTATVEIRIFKGNVSKVGMLKNLEFVHAIVAFTKEATFRTRPLTDSEEIERKRKRKENTDYALHYTYFIDWLNKDKTGNYNNLKLWLSTHKVTDKFRIPKNTDKTPLDKRIIEEDVRACA